MGTSVDGTLTGWRPRTDEIYPVGLHKEVAVAHERRELNSPSCGIWQRDLIIEIMHREQARVKVKHYATHAQRGQPVRIQVAHVG